MGFKTSNLMDCTDRFQTCFSISRIAVIKFAKIGKLEVGVRWFLRWEVGGAPAPPLPHPPTPPFPFIPTPSSSSTLCLMDCSCLVGKVEISVQYNMQDFGIVIGKFFATHQLSLNAGVQNICTPLNEIESDIFCILFSNLWESETSVMYFIVGYYGCVGLIAALGDSAAFQWESPPENLQLETTNIDTASPIWNFENSRNLWIVIYFWYFDLKIPQQTNAVHIITTAFLRFWINVKSEFSAGYLIFAVMFTFGVNPWFENT